ncbi:TSHR [Cordylochernes scorpioides]|uniref:TSHR n=1 Tax=Cordylochernes scorpioides TaxID=51811 RepID=A0ABY6LPI2_9ARAC|nr:TSHR [Cordylochernes scorpioides]
MAVCRSLKGNRLLKVIETTAFVGLRNLRKLDLSETSITYLPTRGLEQLEILKIVDTFTLKKFPSVLHFAQIREAHLTYPYHCCAFRFPQTHDPDNYRTFKGRLAHCGHTTTEQPDTDSQSWGTFLGIRVSDRVVRDVNQEWTSPSSNKDENPFGQFVYASASVELENNESQRWSSVLSATPPEMGFGKYIGGHRGRKPAEGLDMEGTFHRTTISVEPELLAFCGNLSVSARYRHVKCSPEPDAFNPCEDVLGNAGLRACAWLVVVAAVLGNLAVMVVLMSNRFTMSVSKFLMCNLAFADMCMGVYLLVIVAVDAHTMGAYFNYAIDWQHGERMCLCPGIGCQAAGFITVFASELSIYTLALITLERWFAITYAIHLHKRLQLGLAAKIMVAGWVYAITMASLPLLGISAYSKTSICLPMENREPSDLAYLISLLTINGLAFMLISGCYAKMYYSIAQQKSKAINSDMTVAKRMAMLVFTDFACWAPIAFFGLTAVAGHPLIDVTKSKILLVFFYPLNSCANPFLYAILTKQYRRDFFILASRYGFCTKKAMKYKGTYSFNQHHHLALRSNHLVLHSGPRLNRLKDSSEGLADSDTTCEIIRFNSSKKKKRPSRQWSEDKPATDCKGSPHPLKNTFTRSPTFQHQELLKLVISQDAHGSKTPELVWAQNGDP